MPVQDIADLLLNLERADRALAFRALPRDLSAQVFAYLDTEEQDQLLTDLTNEETRTLLANLPPDDRTTLFQELPAQATQRLFSLLSPGDLQEARQLLGYPPESIGRLMTPDYVAVRADWTVRRALEHVRKSARRGETVNVIYVTDSLGTLLDALDLRRLLLADPDEPVTTTMDHRYIASSAFEDREEAVRKIQHYDLQALPVVDSEGVLIGLVTVDDVMDVAREETTEDFHKLGTVGPVRSSIRQAPTLLLYRKRIGWLILLVLVNLFTGASIAYFEDTIEAVIALVFFLPLIIASGGNAGAQATTLTVRALAVGDVVPRDWARSLGKELLVAGALGLTMGVAIAGVGAFWGGPDVGLVVALAMVAVVIIGGAVGILLPFVLVKLNLDPAAASAPLITSLVDILGVIVYFSIATALLPVG